MRALLLATLVAAALPAVAEIYRCKTSASMSCQEQPCDAASQGGAVAIPMQFPDYIEPRKRLVARMRSFARGHPGAQAGAHSQPLMR